MIRRAAVVGLALLAVVAGSGSVAQAQPSGPAPFPPAQAQALDAAARAELEGLQGAALAVGVYHQGRRWTGAFGQADLGTGRQATSQTTFRLASITKAITAAAVLKLHEAGKLDLDADIRRYVPWFPEKPWPITARQILGNLSGIPSYANVKDQRNLRPLDTRQAVTIFADRPLVAAPEMEFVYSTYGYSLLAAAIEAVTGQPFREHLREAVFDPAGMRTGDLDDAASRPAQQAKGYRLVRGRLAGSPPLDVSSRFAGGGARGSVEDLLAFGVAVVEDRLLRRETAAMMQTPQRTRDGRLTDYGLGIAGYPQRGHYLAVHSGGQPETSGLLVILPADGVAIALLSNLEGQGPRLRQLSIRLIEQLLEGGRLRRDAWLADPTEAVQHEALYRTFSYGLAYHEWHTRGPGAPVDLSPEQSARALAGLRRLCPRAEIEPDAGAALARVRQAHEPRGGRVTLLAGMHLARALEAAHGAERLHRYNAEGPLAFFADFLKLPSAREALGEEVAERVARFNEAWAAAQVHPLDQVRLHELADPEALWPKLEQTLALPLRMDLAADFDALAERLEAKGEADAAALWRARRERLYPARDLQPPAAPQPEVPAR